MVIVRYRRNGRERLRRLRGTGNDARQYGKRENTKQTAPYGRGKCPTLCDPQSRQTMRVPRPCLP